MSDRAWGDDIKDIGDKIAALTVSKAVELGDYLEEVHKIKPAAGGGGGGPMIQQQAPAPEKAAEPTEFRVVLEGFDPAKKINVIKVCREITGLGLKEAKDLVEGAPKAVKEGLSKEDAAKIEKQLTDGGAKASVKPM
ncbi:MAG: 50S ribosomal protein L7/L12 [Planctomycetes bacterium]|jgi:large subunit ribosomal protein L7/L12|nr:50S ribosomal protein L7/L12 [Planctomycetota bacterium]